MIAARELTAAGIWIRILAAVFFGGILGIERGMKNRPAGLRTYMLVCIGSCVVMLVNQYIYQVYHTGDPVRMGAQVISGIGFLGAGTIVVTPHNQIRGLTTAAGLWAVACVGLALGLGLYEIALAGGAAIFFALGQLERLDFSVRQNARTLDAYIELDRKIPMHQFIKNMRELDLEISNLQLVGENDYAEETIPFTVTVKSKKKFDHDVMIRTLRRVEGVRYIEEL